MVFVTVGTHEQPFDRLVEFMDNWAKDSNERVIIQTGYCTYEPKFCLWKKLFTYEEMNKNVADARIVITHGGPSSFIMPLQIGKTPIVVPRQQEFNEHVNNHQVEFTKKVAARMRNIIVVEDMDMLKDALENYDQIIKSMECGIRSNNESFCDGFEKIVEEVMNKREAIRE